MWSGVCSNSLVSTCLIMETCSCASSVWKNQCTERVLPSTTGCVHFTRFQLINDYDGTIEDIIAEARWLLQHRSNGDKLLVGNFYILPATRASSRYVVTADYRVTCLDDTIIYGFVYSRGCSYLVYPLLTYTGNMPTPPTCFQRTFNQPVRKKNLQQINLQTNQPTNQPTNRQKIKQPRLNLDFRFDSITISRGERNLDRLCKCRSLPSRSWIYLTHRPFISVIGLIWLDRATFDSATVTWVEWYRPTSPPVPVRSEPAELVRTEEYTQRSGPSY